VIRPHSTDFNRIQQALNRFNQSSTEIATIRPDLNGGVKMGGGDRHVAYVYKLLRNSKNTVPKGCPFETLFGPSEEGYAKKKRRRRRPGEPGGLLVSCELTCRESAMNELALEVQNVDQMTSEQEERFWALFTQQLMEGDDSVAREHLTAGFPVYLAESDTPSDRCIKEYPDGRREHVYFDADGEHFIEMIASCVQPLHTIGK